eukprot:GILI01004081.1.p1 GENE.GILI01004081.1~~GILI01004081.1.p1  ORF type:complete len:258 (+),score=60.82 GILI01004081.1:117-890(+)
MTQNVAKLSVTPENFVILPSSAPDSVLQITNVSFVPILYRALSTAPKQFQVRPRQGIVESGQSASITISYNSKAVEAADAAKAERKEDFKIEYCQMTSEHQATIKKEESAGGDATAKITDLIKAAPKAEKKSRVVSCVIRNAEDSSARTEPKAEATSVAPTEATAASASRASQKAVDAKTDILTSASEGGIRSRASQVAQPAAASETARTPALPEKKAAPNGAVASLTADPVGYLKQNPIVGAGILVVLYILFKIIF